jgi:DNA primase
MVTSDFICVTEGSLDTIWLNQNGFPAVSILGATISQVQEDLLLQLPTNEIVLCLDNDKAGEIGMQKALTSLAIRCKVSRVNLPGGYKDVQDIRNIELLQEVINSRTYW